MDLQKDPLPPAHLLTFTDYDARAFASPFYPNVGANLTYPCLGLSEEVGEVVGKVKKLIRDDNGVLTDAHCRALALECADVLWYLNAMAHEIGYTLGEIAALGVAKVEDRRARGVLSGSGDDR